MEEELQKALFAGGYADKIEHAHFKKLKWSRSSRTDKGVSSIVNINNCIINRSHTRSIDEMEDHLNELLPTDLRIQKLLKVPQSFDAQKHVSRREYIYLLPSFLLKPKFGKFKPGCSMDEYKGDWAYRIEPELLEKVEKLWQSFEGTKKYHNYTKAISFNLGEVQRKMYELTCSDKVYLGDIEYIRFKVVGMSFMYNQIRKMVGIVIEMLRENKEMEYFENSFLANKINIPIAPGEGLYLRKLHFDGYNKKAGPNGVIIDLEDRVC